ncbi:uncharacterized protein LOC18025861 [Eutrema salsugineum]|uniref:uncharacterized protein LOC18025861 n=1 Tax=Eutrema salsugineum TaxID=72664 RepID=UPI000CECF47C|nr:uncharacterized protein LOC18025861 [Eutrema salsugineum]
MPNNHDTSYSDILRYISSLQKTNPNTVVDIETQPDSLGRNMFRCMFLSYAASRRAFMHSPQVIIICGNYLNWRTRSFLIVAEGIDVERQQFPLAFGVLDGDNTSSWKWFLTKLATIFEDRPELTIFSPRFDFTLQTLSLQFPLAEKAVCIRQLLLNIQQSYRNPEITGLVQRASYEYSKRRFLACYKEIKKMSPHCEQYLKRLGFERWSMAFSNGYRFDVYSAEVNDLRHLSRQNSIMGLLHYIHWHVSSQFTWRYGKAMEHQGYVSPYIEGLISKRTPTFDSWGFLKVSDYSCEVVNTNGESFLVDLDRKSCSCVALQKMLVPCEHSLVAAQNLGISPLTLVGSVYSTAQWLKTYSEYLQPYLKFRTMR